MINQKFLAIIGIVALIFLLSANWQEQPLSQKMYEEWKKRYGSSLVSSEQDEYRFRIFDKNLQEIN